jgi:organic radical activating enzyme
MPNSANQRNLRSLIDLLSDNHQEVALEANGVSVSLGKLDEAIAHVNGKGASAVNIYKRQVDRRLDELVSLVYEQAQRCLRLADEVKQIKKNVKLA